MDWLKVRVKIDKRAVEAVANLLIELGSQGVEENDVSEILTEISGYYSIAEKEEIENKLNENLQEIKERIESCDYTIAFEVVRNSDWENNWKEYYKPFYIADGILIKPSWEDIENKKDIIIEMDPGMAFGTGLHETTKLCSEFLKKVVKENDSIIDLGCGTGVLSIVAKKLGAGKIKALDIDPIAVTSSKENFKINNIVNNYDIIKGDIKSIGDFKADVFVSNIIADVLIGIATEIKKYINTGAKIILSGIIKDRADEVQESYENNNYEMLEKKELGEWVALLFKCTDFM